MKRFCLPALMLIVSAAAQSQTAPAPGPESPVVTLVSLMRTDELLVNTAKEGIRRAHADGRITTESRKCAEQIDRAPFTALVAKIYGERLTAEEIDSALEFYRSQAGKKYVKYQFDRSGEKASGRFTIGEEMRINQFNQTKSGRELLTSSIFEGTDEVRTMTVATINDSIAKCDKAAPAAK